MGPILIDIWPFEMTNDDTYSNSIFNSGEFILPRRVLYYMYIWDDPFAGVLNYELVGPVCRGGVITYK